MLAVTNSSNSADPFGQIFLQLVVEAIERANVMKAEPQRGQRRHADNQPRQRASEIRQQPFAQHREPCPGSYRFQSI
jgi:hypothetical protein